MGTNEASPAEAKPRLSRRDRFIIAATTLFALGAAVSALLSSFEATLTFFGEQPSPRENAVSAQSGWVLLWAVATPFCCWGLLQGGRMAVAGVAAWLVLLALCRWWWWPGPPSDVFDTQTVPLWQNRWGVLPWALVAASLVVGLVAAWRRPSRGIRTAAVGLTIAIVSFAGLSYENLRRHAESERRDPFGHAAPDHAHPFRSQ